MDHSTRDSPEASTLAAVRAAAMTSNIQNQAMMQKMLAAILRQEAARIAHENALRKRSVEFAIKTRQSISDFLNRR